MSARTLVFASLVSSSLALAADPPAPPQVGEPPPKTINVPDDVGVGDHFPSFVPGAKPWVMPTRGDMPPPPPKPAQQPMQPAVQAVQAPTPVEAAPIEKPASEPNEWAQIGTTPAPAPAPVPVQAPPAPVQQSAQAAPAPVIASLTPDFERERLERASNELLHGNCETELPRLAELLERTDRADTKARVRILRARCLAHLAKAQGAKAEYTAYLRDFPNGAYAQEARDAQ